MYCINTDSAVNNFKVASSSSAEPDMNADSTTCLLDQDIVVDVLEDIVVVFILRPFEDHLSLKKAQEPNKGINT